MTRYNTMMSPGPRTGRGSQNSESGVLDTTPRFRLLSDSNKITNTIHKTHTESLKVPEGRGWFPGRRHGNSGVQGSAPK